LREGLLQAREVGDHAVDARDRENAQDGSGGDDQQQLTALRLGTLVRREQGMKPGRITKPGPGHVGHERPVPVRGHLQQGRPQRVGVDAGYLTRTRTGRRVRCTVNRDSVFRHSAQEGHRVGPFLALLAAAGTDTATPEPGDG